MSIDTDNDYWHKNLWLKCFNNSNNNSKFNTYITRQDTNRKIVIF